MDFVPYAVPFFLLLIGVELLYGWLRGRNTYRLNDSLSSLSLGIINTTVKLLALDYGGRVFSFVSEHTPWRLPDDAVLTWVIALVIYDLCYYWFHRISHERQIFWASHVAHHQSEEYNLSTALRQTGTGFLLSWIFYVPCFLLGISIEVFVAVASINLIYQFWVHTMHVAKLGPLEWFMVTASNHRVHHAQNPRYLDRNHGGMFIVWDRLFGTYQEELDEEPPVFGITRPLHSWNPIWANVHVYWQMVRDSIAAPSWRDRLYVWVARNGWRPPGAEEHYPLPRCTLDDFHKYDPPTGRAHRRYALLQFIALLLPLFWIEWYSSSLTAVLSWAYFLLVLWTLVDIGRVLEARSVRVLECGRLGLLAALPLVLKASPAFVAATIAYVLLSLILLASLESSPSEPLGGAKTVN